MSLRRVLVLAFSLSLLIVSTRLSAVGYIQTNLVSDQPNTALITDPDLVNPWGVAFSATSPFWVSNNETSKATIYGGDVAGSPFTKNSLTVTIPGGSPTGVVFNGTNSFVLSNGSAARFIFATQTGNLVGWNGTAGTTAIIAHADPADGYTGLAI